MAEINIKEIINDAVEKIMKDEKLQKQFMDEPVKALEKLLNVDLPDELIEKVMQKPITEMKELYNTREIEK